MTHDAQLISKLALALQRIQEHVEEAKPENLEQADAMLSLVGMISRYALEEEVESRKGPASEPLSRADLKPIVLMLPPELYDELLQFSAREGTTPSDFAAFAVAKELIAGRAHARSRDSGPSNDA
jgi:hypothetical protein